MQSSNNQSSTQPPQLIVNVSDGVLVLAINRPERRNAMSPEIYSAMLDSLTKAIDDKDIGAIVLTGTGNAFSAGGDVARMAGATAEELSYEEKIARLRNRARISEMLHTMDKPSIAMIRGPAVGAGLSIAMACDMRFADTSAKLGTAFLNVGLSGDFGGHYFMPRLVGMAKARELYLTTPILNAQESLSIGLLNQVVEPEELEPKVMSIARKLAQGPRTAMAYMKQNLNNALHASLAEVIDGESWRHIRCTETPDHKEATQAYVEKRQPTFSR